MDRQRDDCPSTSDLNMDYRHLRWHRRKMADHNLSLSSSSEASHETVSGLSHPQRPYGHSAAEARAFSPLRSSGKINDKQHSDPYNINVNVISEMERDAYCAKYEYDDDAMQSRRKCKQCQRHRQRQRQRQHCNITYKPLSSRPLAAAASENLLSQSRLERRVKPWKHQRSSKNMVVDSSGVFKALFVLILAIELHKSSRSHLNKSMISRLQIYQNIKFSEQSNHERFVTSKLYTQQKPHQFTPSRCLQETSNFNNNHHETDNHSSFFRFASAFESGASDNNNSISYNETMLDVKPANTSETNPMELKSTTPIPSLELNSTIEVAKGQTHNSSISPVNVTATSVTTMSAIVSNTSQNQLSPGLPINVVCNSRCQCIKLGFQTKSSRDLTSGDQVSMLNHNETLRGRLELEKKLRAFTELHSSMMFADDDNNDANYTRESKSASASSKSSLDNPNLTGKNWQNTRLMANNANSADQQFQDIQQQQQQQNSMVFPLPSNYHHGGQQHHQHYRLMQLYPHLAHHRDRASAAQADPMLNMVLDDKGGSPASIMSKKKLITNNPKHQRNNSVHSDIAVLAGLGSNNNDANYDLSTIIVERIIPLRELNLTGHMIDPNTSLTQNYNVATFEQGNFTLDLREKMTQLMVDVERGEIESLLFSHNSLEFELWAEIYALLVVRARRHLYHLDLSHNQLAKLGVTFTGYIEHHLISSRGDWPFATSNNQSSLLKFINVNNNIMSQPLGAGGPLNLQAASAITNGKSSQLSQQTNKPYTLTSGGKLFTIVQQKLKQQLSSSSNSSISSNINIRALDLSHNSLKWLINDQFRALKHVQSIRLDHNKIRFIHQHAFTGLESLRFLNLAYNKLQVIYIEQFQSNYNLQALSLRANTIAYLRAGSFASLGNLKQLDLSQNKLTILSNNAFIGLESLEWLNLSSNQFVHAPSGTLHPLTGLRKLDLSNNLMAQLAPGTFFHLPIEELWLNQNEQLIGIDRGAFWDMPYLTRLHLHSCPMLMSINSQAFVGIQNLNFIDADDCQSLEQESRQLLENITTASTLRHLRQEQKQQMKDHKLASNYSSDSQGGAQFNNITSNESQNSSSQQLSQIVPHILPKPPSILLNTNNNNNIRSISSTAAAANPDDISHIIDIANHRLKYAYYTTSLVFLIIALKLVLKYTQVHTGRASTSFRNRRRVYETSDSFDADNQPNGDPRGDRGIEGSSIESYELQENPSGGQLRQISSTHKKRNYCSSVSLTSDASSISVSSNSEENASNQRGDLDNHEDLANLDNPQIMSTNDSQEVKHENCVESVEANMASLEDELVEIPLNDNYADHKNINDCQGGQYSSQFESPPTQEPRDIMMGDASCEQAISIEDATDGPCNCSECPTYQPVIAYESIPVATDSVVSRDVERGLASCDENESTSGSIDHESTMSGMNQEQHNLDIQFINCNLCNISQSECDHTNDTFAPDQESMNTTYTQNDTMNQLLQSQLIDTRYEFDHANCNHYYQSLDSAFQFVDLVDHHLNENYY